MTVEQDLVSPKLARRSMLGASAAAATLAVVTCATSTGSKPLQSKQAAADPTPETDGGYQLTDHVKQYYATARI
jgi:hypothetical protein